MNKIAIYLRLSKEDEYVKDESNSISTQREMIHAFIRKQDDLAGMEVIEFKDDGYSGKNMNRPGIQELMELVKKRQIQCIIVKDFSRFSRDYLVIGQYTEQIFPFMQIRFIAINDNYDSNTTNGGVGEIDVAFKSLLYDFYSEDLSMKIKSSFQVKKESGKFLNLYAPYGFQKTTDGSQSLVVEPEGAKIIREIFESYGNGESMYGIALRLNQRNVPCPQEYITNRDQQNYFKKGEISHIWSIACVSRILHNEVYRGCLVYNKARARDVGQHSIRIDKSEWKRIEGAHEAIVDDELWEVVSKRLMKNRKLPKYHESPVLAGKLVCSGCGKVLQTSWIGRPKYICYSRNLNVHGECVRNIRHEDINAIVLEQIQQKIKDQISFTDAINLQVEKHNQLVHQASERYKAIQHSKEKIERDVFNSYESFKSGLTGRETYLQQKKLYDQMLDKLDENLQKQNDSIRKLESENVTPLTWVNQKDYLNITELDHEIVNLLIKKIVIHTNHEIDIYWNFKSGNEMEETRNERN